MTAQRRRQLVSCDEAVPALRQHRTPCSDCPWSRGALPGWLGTDSPEQWVHTAHGEALVECHTRIGAQCAGSAIYRANVCKLPRDATVLRLPADRDTVFATPTEFLKHHLTRPRS